VATYRTLLCMQPAEPLGTGDRKGDGGFQGRDGTNFRIGVGLERPATVSVLRGVRYLAELVNSGKFDGLHG